MTLTANPSNYFAETEQVAFHLGNLVPGIDVTDDPLLQARLFSYVDTQLTRLGGPNFHQIPINRPHAPVNDMLRDGFHQHAVHAGVAPYRPNSLDGGCPFHAGATDGAFVEAAAAGRGHQDPQRPGVVRRPLQPGAPVLAEHDARSSRTTSCSAYTFELTKCFEQVIRERQLLALANIDPDLCARVAEGLGLPAPEPTVPLVDLPASPALSQVGGSWPRRRSHRRHRGRRRQRRRGRRRPGGRDPAVRAWCRWSSARTAGRWPTASPCSAPSRPAARSSSTPCWSAHARRPHPTRCPPSTPRAASRRAGPIDPRVVLLLHEAFRHAKAIGAWGPGHRGRGRRRDPERRRRSRQPARTRPTSGRTCSS